MCGTGCLTPPLAALAAQVADVLEAAIDGLRLVNRSSYNDGVVTHDVADAAGLAVPLRLDFLGDGNPLVAVTATPSPSPYLVPIAFLTRPHLARTSPANLAGALHGQGRPPLQDGLLVLQVSAEEAAGPRRPLTDYSLRGAA